MKHYSLEDAEALLPRVIPVLESLRDAYRELRALEASVAAQSRGASGDGNLLADPWEKAPAEGGNRLEALHQQVRRAATQLDGWGIELKDPDKGLIDFFHERDGRVVYLCFHLGETTIGFWHELSAGFAGRQPLNGQ
jgi:hypothetical protein